MTITLFDIYNRRTKKVYNVADVKVMAFGFKIIFNNGEEKEYNFNSYDFWKG